YYSSYLKGLHGVSAVRQDLMKILDYETVELRLMQYLDYLNSAAAMQDEGVIENNRASEI
ncbi:MAG: hypothetical protein ACM3UR_02140, partial [Bacteroidota bacterium]